MHGTTASASRFLSRDLPARPAHSIYLYSAIGEREQFKPLSRSPLDEAYIRIGRVIDDLLWRGLGRWRYSHWRYADLQGTNIGDIAVREACAELLRRHVPPTVEIRTVSWNGLDQQRVDEINREAAAFVVSGGGYFIFDEDWQIGPRIDADLPAIVSLGMPRIMLGVGVNNPTIRELPEKIPELSPNVEARLRKLLARFELITVRDAFSRDMLQPFVEQEVAVVPDPALLLASLRPSSITTAGYQDGRLRVGLNLALHGSHSELLLQKNFPIYAEAFRAYQIESGCEYIYFPHSGAEWKVADLLSRAGVGLRCLDAPLDQLLDNYRNLSFHVSQMLHSSILAMSTDCPTLNFAYDVKNHAFFRAMGVPELCLSTESITADGILSYMRQIAARRLGLRTHLAARRAVLAPAMDEALLRVRAIIEPRS